LARFVWTKVEEAMMGEKHPGTKPEWEGGGLSQAKAWLIRELRKIGAFVDGLEWPSHWPRWLRVPAILLAGFGAAVVAAAATLFLLLKAAEPSMPLSGDLYALNRPPALTFLDKNGEIAGVRGAIVGEKLKLTEMPRYLPAAFLAMEDHRFYDHHGIDPQGLVRAAIADFKAGHVVQGGSTITQQVVKIVFLSPDRTFSRKLKEIAGAWALERKLGKDQILELYLNRLYLGSGAYGVDGAAHVYFGKSARDVTLAEAAMLAALTRAPSAFSPRRDLAAAQMRAEKVLAALGTSGAASQTEIADARAHPATVADRSEDLARDYFLDAAADEVKLLVPHAHGDLTVSTTMDPTLQKAARAQIANVIDRQGKAARPGQAALVAMTPDGAVRALVGGRDYAESAFNRVTKARRQPGSAFKTFVYLAALEHGLTPATVRIDQPITPVNGWSPDNYNETNVGPVTLEQAYARSINTVAVQLGLEVGIPSVVAVARRLGIQSPLEPYASLALGTSDVTPLELTSAYASFASGGYRTQPYIVRDIRQSNGSLLHQRDATARPRVVSADDVLAMNAMMYQVVQSGTGRAAAVPGHEVAGKTGTSADYRDAWFVGFSPELVTGVWVGNDDSSPMKKITGGSLPAQIWSGFMRIALKTVPATHLPRAEPVAPEAPETAQAQPSGENFFDRVGNFIGNLFSGDDNAKAATVPPRRERSSVAEPGSNFFPETPDANSSAAGNLNTDGNASTAIERSANNRVAPLPDPGLPSVRPDNQGVRNLDEIRRSMAQQPGQRLADETRERYRSEAENPNETGSDRYNYRYDNVPPTPRRYYGPPPMPRYEPMPPPMPRWEPPPRSYSPPAANDDRGPSYPDDPR
jgi:penicillin-binding protein 1A